MHEAEHQADSEKHGTGQKTETQPMLLAGLPDFGNGDGASAATILFHALQPFLSLIIHATAVVREEETLGCMRTG